MPSAGTITDLVLYAGFAIISTIVILILMRFTPMGKKLSQNNNHLDYTRPAPPSNPKANYVDPIPATNIKLWLIGFSIAIVLFFVYYFALKGGFYLGN